MPYKYNVLTGNFDLVTASASSSAPGGYVPYVGATSSVNLGTHKLIASAVTAGSFTASTTAQPFITASTQLNTNFNADLLDTLHATAFLGAVTTGGISATSPMSITSSRQVLGGTADISIDTSNIWAVQSTGNFTASSPLSLTNTRQLLGGAAALTIDTSNLWAVQTTGVISGTSPIGVTSGRQAIGGALAISIDTTNLFQNVTTGTVSGSAPVNVTASRQAIGGALAISLTTAHLISSTSALVIGSAGTGSILNSNVTMSIASATTTQTGLLTSTDWGTFNAKWATQTTAHLVAGTNISLTGGGTGSILGASNVTITASMATGGPTQPGGSYTFIQYNDNTTFGGSTAFVMNLTSFAVTITPASGSIALNIKQGYRLVLDN